MKSKKLPKDTKAAVYIRVGREEQLLDAVTEFIEKENEMSDKLTFRFTEEEVKVLRDSLQYSHNKTSTALFERLSNRLRELKKERYNVINRSSEASQREVQQEGNQDSH